ncbi:ferric reduction oxidase 2-like [Aristolochia californica]|uniref:ferric reduction oxidase 2-like n=1 Tax=Aristolochia californica TaxID=171875 RepID=UPI0035D9E4F2
MVLPGIIKKVIGVIFLGYLMIWVLTPTNLWRMNWLLDLRAQTDSRYFGQQGANMLVYTFSVLLIAVLGCLYLDLQSNRTEEKKLARWRRPILVKGPLGVVSALELVFLSLFLALLIWSFSTYLSIRFREINNGVVSHHHHGHMTDAPKWVQKLRSSGFYLGILGNICCAFLFYPVTRGSSILPLLGLTSEGSIKYHIWLGHITMIFFTAHGIIFLLYWAITNDLVEIIKWDKTGVSNVAGEISLLFGIAIWITVFPRLRRNMFELFFYTHQLYTLFIFFYVLHVGFTFFCIMLPGFYLFLIDRYLRFLQSRQKVRLVSARLLPCETLELNFSKSPVLHYNPTSIVFINVPFISSLQWHPFTVSSNSNLEPDKLSVVIKKEGSWTAKLYDTLASPSPVDRLEVSLEGPYGPISVDFLRHDSLVMIAGGSGITPMISLIRDIIFRKATMNCPTPRIILLCAFKHGADLTMLDLLLPITGVPIDITQLQIEIKAFVTRDKEPSTGDKSLVRTIWFKPNPTDVPVSAALGTHAWVWLGAIISTSFVIFLIIMGIIGGYYIYPIDKNTNEVYSYSSRAVLNMLVICAVIMGTASTATLWNKRRNAREDKQIQNIDVSTPTTSPGCWAYNVDRELESQPQQSLIQNTKVHFGSRPDLKKMLLEYEGSSTGVLVSGPTEMRHEVAGVCSSSTSGNLHYEAVSFNW